MTNVGPLIQQIAEKHGFELGQPNSALLVSAVKDEGEYRKGELLITVWNNDLRYSVGRVVFGGGVRKRMGFTVWFDADWIPRKAVNDLEMEVFTLDIAEQEMTELITAFYLSSERAEKWQQEEDIRVPDRKPKQVVVPRVMDADDGPMLL